MMSADIVESASPVVLSHNDDVIKVICVQVKSYQQRKANQEQNK